MTSSLSSSKRNQNRIPWDFKGLSILFSSALFYFLWSIQWGLHWHDTSEWIATSHLLSLSHPPGHPLSSLSTHFFQGLPWMDIPFRSHFMSTMWTLMGMLALYQCIWNILDSFSWLNDSKRLTLFQKRFICFGYAWIYGLLPLVFLQAIRCEVYAPQAALMALLWMCLSALYYSSDLRWGVGAGLMMGLMASNHTLSMLAGCGSVFLWLICIRRRFPQSNLRLWVGGFIGSVMGLTLYLYLPLRGQSGGWIGWGWIDDLSSFWNTISAKVWQNQVNQRMDKVNWGENMIRFTLFFIKQGGLIAVGSFCFLGIGTLVRWFRLRKEVAFSFSYWPSLLFLSSFGLCLTKLSYPFLEINPDFSGYLAPAISGLCLLTLFWSFLFSSRLTFLYLSLTLSSVIWSHSQSSLISPWQPHPSPANAETWGKALLKETPPFGTLWASDYASYFILQALQSVEGRRPDLRIGFRGHRLRSWYKKRWKSKSLADLPLDLNFDHLSSFSLSKIRFEVPLQGDPLPKLNPLLKPIGLTWAIQPPLSIFDLSSIQIQYQNLASLLDPDLYTLYVLAVYHQNSLQWIEQNWKNLSPQNTQLKREQLEEFYQFEKQKWLDLIIHGLPVK